MKKRMFLILLLLSTGLLVLLFFFFNQTFLKEKQLTASAIAELAKAYHFPKDKLEVISIKEADDPYKYKLLGIDKIFGGKDYVVQIKVNESVPIDVEGTINSRKRILRDNNYIQKKHEAMLEKDNAYRQLIESLQKQGVAFNDLKEDTHYKKYREGIRTLHFNLEIFENNVDAERVTAILHTIADKIIVNVKTNIALQLTIPTHEYSQDNFHEKVVQVKIDEEQKENVVMEFQQLLQQVRSLGLMDEKLIQEVEAYGTKIFTSRIASKYRANTSDFYYHKFGLLMQKDFSIESLPHLIKLLKNKGFGQSYIYLQFSDGSTSTCKVEDIEKIDDFNTCSAIEEY